MDQENHDDDDDASSSCSKKRIKTYDNGGVASWSDLNHDLLCLVMLQLGVVDFVAFSGVCRSWRSHALSNKKWFMASRPPMWLSIKRRSKNEDWYCYLEDSKGRRFKTILPHSNGRKCIGITCGYVILFGRETRDFWLVNPITRHELHFTHYPLYERDDEQGMSAILVFSPSISGLVFVVLNRQKWHYIGSKPIISFCVEGKQRWNDASSRDTPPIVDLHFFKGKIYILHDDCSLSILGPHLTRNHKLTLLNTKNLPNPEFSTPRFISSNEKLFVVSQHSEPHKALELDFGVMEWVLPLKAIGEYAFFFSGLKSCAAIKPESWADPRTRYRYYGYFQDDDGNQQIIYFYGWMWYLPHECLNVSVLDD